MKNKRISSFLMAIVMVFSLIAVPVNAANVLAYDIVVDKSEVTNDTEHIVTVNINIDQEINANVVGYIVKLPEGLEYVSLVSGENSNCQIDVQETSSGYKAIWESNNNQVIQNLGVLTVKVPQNTLKGTYTIEITDIEIFDEEFNVETSDAVTATITVTDPEQGGGEGGEGGGDTNPATFSMYYKLADHTDTDGFKDIQLNTATDAENLVAAEIFVVCDQAMTLQAYDIYLTYNSSLTYNSETMLGTPYVDKAAHNVPAQKGNLVTHIQMLDDEGTYELTAGVPESLGTIVFDVSKNAVYDEDLEINLANGAPGSTNVAVAKTGAANGDKTSYYPTVTQTVGSVTHSGVEVMNTYTVMLNANTGKVVTGMPDGNKQTKEYNKSLTLPTLTCTTGELAFKGWTTAVDPDFDAAVEYKPGASYTANAGTTLYAVWQKNAYPITLNTDSGAYVEGYTAPSTYIYGEGATLPTGEEITKTGYTFGGWYDNAQFDGSSVTEITATDSGEKEYWVKWTPIAYTINFKNGDNVLQNTMFDYGTTPVYSGATPTKADTAQYTYTFAGWDPAITTVTGETTYTATFTETLRSYTVTYAAGEHGSVTAKSEEIAYGSKPTYTTYEANAGYHFVGWYDGTSIIDVNEFTVTGPVTLTAQFEANKYIVEFYANGGTGTMTSQEFTYGVSQALKLNEFTKPNANFAGWKVNNQGDLISNGAYLETLATEGTVTLYAQWTDLYTVTLGGYTESQGVVTANPQTAAAGTEITLTATAEDGYSFTGFTVKDENNVDVIVSDGKFIMPAANVTVTATFTAIPYDITVTNDGKGSATANPNPATVGQTITLSDTPNTGYKLKSYSSTDVTVSNGTFTMPAKAVTINVEFEGIDYKIAFKPNADGVTGEIETVDAKYGTNVTLPTTGFTKIGYTLIGWTDVAGGTEVTVGSTVNGLTTEEGTTVTLYAVWQANIIDVTLNANEGNFGENTTKDVKVTFGEAYGTLETPTRTGYTFAGWNTVQAPTDDNKGEEVTATTIVSNEETHSLFAQWTPVESTITLKPEGGTLPEGASDTKEVTYDATYGDLPAPSRDGYEFDGWFIGEDEIESNTTVDITKDTDVLAKWTPIPYEITFNLDGGEWPTGVSYTDNKLPYDITKEDELPAAEKYGYTFNGWKPEADAGSWDDAERYNAGTSVKGEFGNVTLVAQWTRSNTAVVEDYKFAATGYVMLRVADNAAEGKVYKFGDQIMYWIDNEYYNIDVIVDGVPKSTPVYYTLIEEKYVENNGELTKQGYELLSTETDDKATVTYDGDINDDGTINIADANIVYQMVEQSSKGGYYTDLSPEQRLSADMAKAHEQTSDLFRGSIDDVNEIINIINGAN